MNVSKTLIKNLSLFAKLSDADIDTIQPICSLLQFNKPATIVFDEGDPGDAFFLIVEGSIEIRKTIDRATGSDKTLATLPAGSFFGEMALLTGETRSAAALTHSRQCLLLKVPRDEFLRLMAKKPDVAALLLGGLIGIISERLRATSLEAVTLYETGRIISSTTDLGRLSQGILETVVRALGAQGGFILLWNEIVECFECHAAMPGPLAENVVPGNCRLSEYIFSLTEPSRHSEPQRLSEGCAVDLNGADVLFVPLITDCNDAASNFQTVKRVAGAIVLTNDKPGFFTLPHMTLLQGVAGQVSQAMLNNKLLQENEARRAYNQQFIMPGF